MGESKKSKVMPTSFSKAAEVYNRVANDYDGFYVKKKDLAEDEYIRQILSQSTYCQGQVLDLGCGTGLLCSLADLDPENYIGLDPAQKMLEIAKAKFPGARFVQACCESMPNIETESVDSVTSIFGSFSYVTKPDEAVQEIYRVLKPGGSIFIMAYGPAHKGGSVLPDASIRLLGKLWNSPGLETLFASQFSDAKIVGIGAANRLLDVLGPQQGAQLIDLESQVTDPSYRDECRWLIVTARKTQKNKKV